jgi:heterodisulfide reductase subunit C
MDYPPAQLMHAVRLGLKDLVLNSSTIWVCASCETCTTRCPQEVDIAKVMDALRAMAVRTGVKPKERDVSIFHGVGLNNLRLFGRMHELSLAGMLMLSTRNFSKDMGLGMKMIKKGKMKLLPSFKGAGTMRKIFSKVKEAEKA